MLSTSPQKKLDQLKGKKLVEALFEMGKMGVIVKMTFNDGTRLTFGTVSGQFEDGSGGKSKTVITLNGETLYGAVITLRNPPKR